MELRAAVDHVLSRLNALSAFAKKFGDSVGDAVNQADAIATAVETLTPVARRLHDVFGRTH